MKRLACLITLLLVFAASVVATAPAARADDHPSWRITRYDATAIVDKAGVAKVTVDFDFYFGSDAGHGPYVSLLERQEVREDPGLWRMLDVNLVSVSSTTGAATDTKVTHENGRMFIRIGDPNRKDRTGTQRYVVVYTIRGLVAPKVEASGMDELNWSAVGLDWEVPLEKIGVVVTGPAPVQRATCFYGSLFSFRCSASQVGSTATFTTQRLGKGEGMQVTAGFPTGTFVGAEPRFEKRYWIGNVMPLTPVSGGLTGLLTALGVVGVALTSRRASRDEAYVGLTPGLTPAAGQQATIGRAIKTPVTVQFTPPKNTRPGEIGTLVDATANNVDITATIIDLAVRGHIRITELGHNTWRFIYTGVNERLTPVEQHLLRTMFSAGPQVTTKELADKSYSDLLEGARTALYDRVTNDLGWFKKRPTALRGTAVAIGLLFILGGAALGWLLGITLGLGLVGLAPILVGLLIVIMNNRFGRRTAEGSAVLAQAKGFELYLRTAEADQIRFEESIDVFSRYLPYAIVFGVADRWSAIFQRLAAEGRYQGGIAEIQVKS